MKDIILKIQYVNVVLKNVRAAIILWYVMNVQEDMLNQRSGQVSKVKEIVWSVIQIAWLVDLKKVFVPLALIKWFLSTIAASAKLKSALSMH